MAPVGKVQWQGIQQARQVKSREELCQVLEQAQQDAAFHGWPLALELCIKHHGTMSILIGADRSYVLYKPEQGCFQHAADDINPRGCLAFLDDGHLSEIDLKFTVPAAMAHEALLFFAETGAMPESLPWANA